MFTYINPDIRERLIRDGKLFRINSDGATVDMAEIPETGLHLNLMGPIPLPLARGHRHPTVKWYASVRSSELTEVEHLASTLREQGGQHLFSHLASSMAVNSVLVIGEPEKSNQPLVRVHSSCLTGDVLGSKRCECGPQLESALDRIADDPEGGYLIYMAGHEGRGIGLWAKAATYLLQDAGENTYQANRSLGLPMTPGIFPTQLRYSNISARGGICDSSPITLKSRKISRHWVCPTSNGSNMSAVWMTTTCSI